MDDLSEASPEQLQAEILRLRAQIARDTDERVQAEQALQRAADRLQILADASHAFAEAGVDEPTVLDLVARITSDALGAGCVIRLCEDGSPWLPAVTIYDPDPDAQAAAQMLFGGTPIHIDAPQPAAQVIRNGQPQLYARIEQPAARAIIPPELWPALARVSPHSSIIVPLRAHAQILGSISFSRHTPDQPPFSIDDLTLAQDLADRAALAITNARLYRQAQESQRSASETLARLDALISSVPVGIGYFDRDLRHQMLNPALAAINGLPLAEHLGRPLPELFPDLALRVEPQLRQVLTSGVALLDQELPGLPAPGDGIPRDWLVSYFPVSGADGAVAGVGVTVTDNTARKRREANLAFLNMIADDLSRLSTAEEIMHSVGATIGAYLNLSNCLFAAICEAEDSVDMAYAWQIPGIPEVRGKYPLSTFVSQDFVDHMRAGEVVVVCDTQNDLRTSASQYAALHVYAFVCVPSHRFGEWLYLFIVSDALARAWREDEIELICEVSNRTFPRIERAHAEAALRESEAAEHAARLEAEAASERTMRLQAITADLAGALMRNQVITVVTGHGTAATGAAAVIVTLLDPDAEQLVLVGWSGRSAAEVARLQAMPLSLATPMSAVVHEQTPIWLGSQAEAESRFPGFGAMMATFGDQAIASLPLISAEHIVGVMSFGYAEPQLFSPEDRAFIHAITQQCAQALERVRLYSEVIEAHARLRILGERLVAVQEEERQHLARELHDEIGQALTGLSLILTIGPSLTPDLLHAQLAKARRQVTDLIAQVRRRSLDLRPSMLDDMGLHPALAWFLARYSEQTRISLDVQLEGIERRFPPIIELTAYRIVQEALTNVARHADVQHAHVAIWTTGDELLINITDLGRGFDLEEARRAHASSGLTSMRERAVLLGGDLTINTELGAGTNLLAILPIVRPG
jgi:PAS domain S-box-containing protein